MLIPGGRGERGGLKGACQVAKEAESTLEAWCEAGGERERGSERGKREEARGKERKEARGKEREEAR